MKTYDIKDRGILSSYPKDSDWEGIKTYDKDHKRWNQIVGGDTCVTEFTGHPSNKTLSVLVSEFWVTEKGRHMERTISTQLDENATRQLFERLKKILGEA